MKEEDQFLKSTERLLNLIPNSECERVFKSEHCHIEPVFMGFIDVYDMLSRIIPTHFTIIDLGCAYNPQCYFFKDHLKYIAVDASWEINESSIFKTDNTQFFNMTIQDFIATQITKLNLDETFAICSYVPPWYSFNTKIVREAFKNVFVYYPHGGFDFNKPSKI